MRSISIGDKFGNRSRISGAGKKPKFAEIETALVKWVGDRRSKGWAVTRTLIHKCALEIHRNSGNKDEYFCA